jgi:Fe-S oxidoreductase
MWNEPGNGRDAIRLLEAFGYRVVLAEADCCGRTCCSAGMLEQAVDQIEASAPCIHQAMLEHGAEAVVAIEPSCATTLQQEWLELRTNTDPKVMAQVAAGAHTVESFLIKHWLSHPVIPDFRACSSPIMVHVHCHQKHRADLVAELLVKCGCEGVELLDSGCCGMAGSFGYDAEHFELSGQIAEQSLGEAMRRRGDAIVVAHGTSCRHQLIDIFQVKAKHPAGLLAELLA